MCAIRGCWIGWIGAVIGVGQLAGAAMGQGIVIDRRPQVPIAHSYEIREVGIDARVRDQVAEVQVSQTFHNPGSFQLEAEFLFPLPDESAIQSFVLMVDGRELPGKLLPREEARRIYEEIIRIKRDPALLEYMGRGLFRTSVFPIPPGADRKVTMRYTQLCRRDRDIVEFSYPLSTQKFTSKPIDQLLVRVSIEGREGIKSVYCPSDDARIERTGDREARVALEQRDIVPGHDFRLVYTLAEGAVGASILSYRPSASDDGYFLLLASPEVKAPDAKPLSKTVIFVIDRSGSMAGKKIEQARRALKSVLNNLRDEDLFNIVVYDDRVENFKPELERYSARSREDAERFVDNIREGGSTNIDAALKSALGMIQDSARPSYILFLTDGLPTAGEQRELAISDNCHQANARHARVFCFGVGFDVNSRLLDRLSGGNGGTSEYVRPDEDIEAHVGRFYSKMSSPVLAGIHVELAGTEINRACPRDIPDLFQGGQIAWVGRYRRSGPTKIRITGKIGTEQHSLEFPAELAGPSSATHYDFVERLWAVRRAGDLIDQIDLRGENRELTDELVALGTRYGILTPYTSFLADERVLLHADRANSDRARRNLQALSQLSGESGVNQRAFKQDLMKAERSFGLEAQQSDSLAGGARVPAAPAARAAMSGGSQSGGSQSRGMMGLGGMMGGGAAMGFAKAAAPGQRTGGQVDAPLEAKVRLIGPKTFYWKKGRWIDSSVTDDEDAKATVLVQLSDAYFELARTQTAEFNQYLSQAEPVTVKIQNTVYRIEQSKPEPTR